MLDSWYVGLFLGFGDKDREGDTQLVRVNASALDLNKICLLDDVADDISRGKCSLDAATLRVDELLQPTYISPILTLLAYFLISGSFSVFFDGYWTEVIASFIAGLFAAILALLSPKVELFAKLFNMLCAVISTFVGIGARLIVIALNDHMGWRLPEVHSFKVALAGIIVALPGLTFTIAMTELSYGSLVSGAARLLSGFLTVLQLAFGLVLGKIMM
jgi:uncharacterized membrane protein YjjP (DUF1212 family)